MPLVSLDQILNKSFDYIIIGGGTAGLVIAARLSEDPEATVLVLDAGLPNSDEPLITRPAQFGFQCGRGDLDWEFKTAPQKHANDRQIPWNRGKSLGGSSAMNFSFWILPPKEDIDAWEQVGNEGWNWETIQKYHDRVVQYVPLNAPSRPDSEALSKVWDTTKYSTGSGPLAITHPRVKFDIDVKSYNAFLESGMPEANDPYHGDPKGAYVALNSVDPKTHLRSYAAKAFFEPNSARTNLLVLPMAYVHRIVTTPSVDGELVATGVEFNYANDTSTYVLNANREVVLCAGAIKSPQILELSGIGREEVLDKIGVPLKVHLRGVGENVQEHSFVAAAYELKPNTGETLDLLRDAEKAAKQVELLEQGEGAHASGITTVAFLPLADVTSEADTIIAEEGRRIRDEAHTYPPGRLETLEAQLKLVRDGSPGSEFSAVPAFLAFDKPPQADKTYITIFSFLNHSFSRGTIHSASSNPLEDPAIDPHYLEHDIDRQILIEGVKYARKIAANPALKEAIATEHTPGYEVQTDEQLSDWIGRAMNTTWHTAGSCSMLPRHKQGVVDPQLKVYGTTNLRIADLSIVPLHFAAHSQAVVYAIGEIASDIIKGRFNP